MPDLKKINVATMGVGGALVTMNTSTLAAVSEETAGELNTFSVLGLGFFLMVVAAGLVMLKVGQERTMNIVTNCLKNIALWTKDYRA